MSRSARSSPPIAPPLAALLEAAQAARGHAYAPYSNFAVGAAVRTSDGAVYTGCNVENASYGLTVCAERVAVWKAVSEGARAIVAVAVVTDATEPAAPCGACRQVLAEFAADAEVAIGNLEGTVTHTSVAALLPLPFRLKAS
ncbi:MAG: cytidine deaminase [Casimicrobiaceae bacterium]